MQKDLFGNEIADSSEDKVQWYIKNRDEFNSAEKVDRLRYLHKINPEGFSMWGQTELVLTMREVQFCFIDGHFLATIVLAQAFVEKVLHAHYFEIGFGEVAKKGLNAIIKHAQKNKVLNSYVLAQADKIRLIRNPITHIKDFEYEHNLDRRSFKSRVSPMYQLSNDAKEAIEIATFIAISDLKRLL